MTDAPEPTPDTPRTGGLLSGERGTLAALVVSIVALVAAVAPYATGGDFEGRVRTYLVSHPEVLAEAQQAYTAKSQQLQADEISRRVIAAPGVLTVDASDPAFGPVDARVTVIEFFDFRCPGCKATAPSVLELMRKHPDVRFVFMDWPILDHGDDTTSHYAARAAQAAHAQGKYLPVFRALMAEPGLTMAAVDRILRTNGVVAPEAVMTSAGTSSHLATIDAAGRLLQLYGTPTFFVNGRAQGSPDPRALERAILDAKAGRTPPLAPVEPALAASTAAAA